MPFRTQVKITYASTLSRWHYEGDWTSIGYFYGKPIDRSLDEEHGMEIYWRAQITRTIELTPDFQVYFDRAGQAGPAFFGALRIRFIL